VRAMLGSFGCRDNFEGAQVPNTARWTRRRPCRSRAEPATWIWTAALVCVASSRVLAQADEGLLSITVAVPMSDRVAVTEDARRLYVESDELHLDVSVVNPSDSRITIDQEQLQRAFRLTLTAGGTSLPVVATWSDDALVIAPDSDRRARRIRCRTRRLVSRRPMAAEDSPCAHSRRPSPAFGRAEGRPRTSHSGTSRRS